MQHKCEASDCEADLFDLFYFILLDLLFDMKRSLIGADWNLLTFC